MFIEITLAGAFLGGTLALLSPCSALLLPAFFAYAFKSKTELASRTFVFLLGLATLFIPLGMGASLAGAIILDYRTQSIWIVGLLLIVFGALELLGIGFTLLPRRFQRSRIDSSLGSVYATGLVYGFAGFCSGPLLGAVLTMAAGAGGPWQGAGLLFAYAVGMAFPLFLLALLWDRYELGSRQWLRGKSYEWGPFSGHTTNLISGGLFVLLGLLFIGSGGTVAFEQLYAKLGLVEWSLRLQQTFNAWSTRVPNGLWWLFAAVFGGYILWRRRGRGNPTA